MSQWDNAGPQKAEQSQSVVQSLDGGPFTVEPSEGSGQFPTGNITKKYRTNCDTLPTLPDWNVTLGTGDLLLRDGNCQGASYWVLSKSPFNVGTRSVIDGTQAFDMPTEFSFGLHRSQAALNQEFAIQVVDSGTPASTPAEVAVSALLQATTTLTVTTSAPHNLAAGQAFGIYGCADSRFNYGALVVASVISATQFTATAGPGGTIPSLSASPAALGSPFIYVRRRLGGSADGTSMIFENATATNASFYVRSNSGDAAASGAASGNHSITVGTTASTQSIAGSGAYSFFPGTEFRLNLQADRVQWHGAAADGVAATSNWITRTSLCPSPDLSYKMRLEAVNNKGLTAPVGRIVSAVKVASTTATITFAEPHGCTVDDYLVGYGVRDQAATAFANLTTATKVASIVSPTVLTIVWGSSGTATSYGGYMSRVQGGAAQNGAVAQVFQNVTITDGLLTCTGSATWAGLVIGDLVEIYGVRNNANGASLGIDGTYKVRNLSTTVMTLEVPDQSFTPPANLVSTDCGGGVIKRSDFRVSFIRGYEYLRERVEYAPRPSTDGGAAVPTNVVSMPTTTVTATNLSSNMAQMGGTTTAAGISSGSTNATLSVNTASGISNTDQNATAFAGGGRVNGTVVASARGGSAVISAEINVSALTLGTATSVVFVLQESAGGTNFTDIWFSDPITATGIIRVPPISVGGRRRWCAHSVGGTSTTVTATITALELPPGYPVIRQYRDAHSATNPLSSVINSATAVATTLVATGSTCMTANTQATAPLVIEGCKISTMHITLTGTPTVTTQPVLALELSQDATNWFVSSATVTAAGAGTYSASIATTAFRYARIRVTTAAAYSASNYTISSVGITSIS